MLGNIPYSLIISVLYRYFGAINKIVRVNDICTKAHFCVYLCAKHRHNIDFLYGYIQSGGGNAES